MLLHTFNLSFKIIKSYFRYPPSSLVIPPSSWPPQMFVRVGVIGESQQQGRHNNMEGMAQESKWFEF